MLSIRVVSWALATTSLISFFVCVMFELVTPDALHMRVRFEQLLPGFKWLTLQGFLIGLVESFLYGASAGLVYVPVYNFFVRRFDPDHADPTPFWPLLRKTP